MKLLITGGAGFIGSNFIHYWLKEHPDDQIINLDLLTYAGNLENLKDVENNSRYEFVMGDIRDANVVDEAMKGVDIVVHFAAESHVDRSILNPAEFLTTNVLGTQILMDAALKHKVKRFHHVSTDEVYGDLPLNSEEKFTEHTAYDPHSPYSASKAASDHLARAYFRTYGLPVTLSNTSNNYGPYQNPEKFLPRIITNLLDGHKIQIYGDGKNVRDWLFVDDHCRGIDLVLQKGKLGETYLLGGMTDDVNNLEVAKMVLKIMGKTEDSIEFVKDRPGHDRRYAVDWTKAKQELGWSPAFDFDKFLVSTIDWYKNHEQWWRPLKEQSESIYKN